MTHDKTRGAAIGAKFKQYLFPSNATYYAEPLASRERRRDAGAGLRRPGVPRLLRRDPDRQRRPREPQSERGRARADGAPRARVDALPDPPDRRARREAREARAGQAREGVLLHERHRGRRDRRGPRAGAHGTPGDHRAAPRVLGAVAARAGAHGAFEVPRRADAGRGGEARPRAVLLPMPFRPAVSELRGQVRDGHRRADPDDDRRTGRGNDRGADPWGSAASSPPPKAG